MTALALANSEHLQRERLHGERMESLEKVKSEILNLVSHELRSPITVAPPSSCRWTWHLAA